MKTKLIVTALTLLSLNVAFATDDSDLQQIESKFKSIYPKTTITAVRQSEIKGLYEVVMGSNVAYTDEAGRYFLFGHIYDMQKQVDLTTQRQQESKKAEFPQALLSNAIKTVKGDGSRVFAVFTDPDCPYCKHLELELQKLNNYTAYRFIYPLESLHPEAKTKAVSVWCAKDREKAWFNLMLANKTPKLVTCANPINDNLVLGSKLGVVGTPTLISIDGRLFPGSAQAEKIDQWLNASSQEVAK